MISKTYIFINYLSHYTRGRLVCALSFLLLFLSAYGLHAQVNFVSSNLPIMVIDTDGNVGIPDDPKIGANMRLINRNNGEKNLLTDPGHDYEGRIGIEIRGSTSASIFPKVGYGFETRNADGSNNNVEMLGLPEENDWVLHGPYSDKTLMRNAMAYILAAEIMEYAPRVRHIELMINDQYQGVYLLTEKIKRDKNRVDISKLNLEDTQGDQLTGGYIFKIDKYTGNSNGWPSSFNYIGDSRGHEFLYHYPKYENMTVEQINYLQNYIFEFELRMNSTNFNNPETGYTQWIDEESFMDIFFINEIAKNIDGYRLSTYFYKDRDSVDHRIKVGPVWDFNLGFGNANYCDGNSWDGWVYQFNDICPDDNWKVPFFFEKLYDDLGYRSKIKQRWTALRQGVFSNENIVAKIDSISNLLSESQQRNFARWPVLNEFVWPNPDVHNSYSGEVAHLKSWLENRLLWMDGQVVLLDTDKSTLPPNFSLYPNPSSGMINMSIPATLRQSLQLLIYDSLGRLVSDTVFTDIESRLAIENIDISHLAKGTYFFTLIQNKTILKNGNFVKF